MSPDASCWIEKSRANVFEINAQLAMVINNTCFNILLVRVIVELSRNTSGKPLLGYSRPSGTPTDRTKKLVLKTDGEALARLEWTELAIGDHTKPRVLWMVSVKSCSRLPDRCDLVLADRLR